MRSIAIINQKGGVGKTTTAVNISAALALDGQRVLLLDLDPQSHATLHLGIELGPNDPSTYDVIVHNTALADAARSAADRLVVIPAHIDLVGAEIELASRAGRETVLARTLRPYQQGFDFCVIDCAPSLGLLTINALAAVEEVIIPLQPHFLALQGLGRLLDTVSLVRQALNPILRISGVVLCMYERGTRLAQEVTEDVARFLESAQPDDPWFGARIFSTAIRRNIKLAECPSFGQTVFEYAPGSHGAEDYGALATEIRTSSPGTRSDAQADDVTATITTKPAATVLPAKPAEFAPPPTTSAAPPVETNTRAAPSSSPQPQSSPTEDVTAP